MKTDIQIATEAKMLPIKTIADELGVLDDELELYGKYKAKITDEFLDRMKDKPDGKLILVTAINPTPAGEGKTTTSVGLGMAMKKIGKKAIIALREPSLGPVFGIKGGAAGGGYSQVVPMEDINLHFTGDFHAITAANNLLCAIIDNHIHQGNELGIDQRRVLFARVTDTNDRALRNIVVGLGAKVDGIPREDHFMITVASEVMAILCLADSLEDLKERLGNILVAYTYDNKPVFCRDLKVNGAMAALLKDAIKPNLVQTLENTPALIHGGPFANIAHGCNSVRATKLALKLADYTITEAGFGADLGAEKFFDIKCRKAGLTPSAVVLVATVRALKAHGGAPKVKAGLPLDPVYTNENLELLEKGCDNLLAHIDIIRRSGVQPVVCLNAFYTDTPAERELVRKMAESAGAQFAVSDHWLKGGEGALELAETVIEACNKPNNFDFLCDLSDSLESRIEKQVVEVYGGEGVDYTPEAKAKLDMLQANPEIAKLPICIAKTQYSLSHDANLSGRPKGWRLPVRDILVYMGAGLVVPVAGEIRLMPGTSASPAYRRIDVDTKTGKVKGLF